MGFGGEVVSQLVGAQNEQQAQAVGQPHREPLRLLQEIYPRMQRPRPGSGRHRGDEQQPVQRPVWPFGPGRRCAVPGNQEHADLVLFTLQEHRRDGLAGKGLADSLESFIGCASQPAFEFEHLPRNHH